FIYITEASPPGKARRSDESKVLRGSPRLEHAPHQGGQAEADVAGVHRRSRRAPFRRRRAPVPALQRAARAGPGDGARVLRRAGERPSTSSSAAASGAEGRGGGPEDQQAEAGDPGAVTVHGADRGPEGDAAGRGRG